MTYARLLHDVQRADLQFRARSARPGWTGRPHPPETVRFYERNAITGKFSIGKSVKLSPEMDRHLLKINGKRAYKAITNPPAGWINDPPNPELLSFGGDLVDLDKQDGEFYRVRALAWDTPLQALLPLSYTTHPEYIHKFCAVKRNGGFLKLGFGIDAYIPLLKKTEIWLHESQFEPFPDIIPGGLPVTVTARGSMFASGDLHVRLHPDPSGFVLGALNHGDIVRVLSYHCSKGDVWGLINISFGSTTNGPAPAYINLQRQSGWRVEFFTTWKMETAPPL